MAPVSKLCGLSSQLFRNKAFIYSTARCYSDRPMPWTTLWKPDKFQKENHDQVAKKYNLHPKEYKPTPEEKGIGDYPELPMVGPAAKDPYYPYDIPTYKKNYGEPVHHYFHIMGEDRFSYGYKYRINLYAGTGAFLAFIATLFGIGYFFESYPTFMPRMEKQYPQKGKVHYTFESANS